LLWLAAALAVNALFWNKEKAHLWTVTLLSLWGMKLFAIVFAALVRPDAVQTAIGIFAGSIVAGAFLGFFLFFKSLSFYELSKAVAIRSIEPFFVVILSLIILGLLPSGKQLIGGTMIVAGIVILNIAAGLKRLESKIASTI